MACRPERSRCAEDARRRSRVALLAAATLAIAPQFCSAKPTGTGDRAAREAATATIPWDALAAKDRERVERIVGRATLYRSLPIRQVECDGPFFIYLADHPEVVAESWNVMGISRMRLERVNDSEFRAADPAGAVGDLRVLHRSGGGAAPLSMLVLADGEYKAGPMVHPIRGSSVLLFRGESHAGHDGEPLVTAQLDSFIRFDGPSTRLVAKTLQPLIVRTADHNFVETMRFVSLFSRTAQHNPAGMGRLAGHLTRVDEPTRRGFVAVCQQAAYRHNHRPAPAVASVGAPPIGPR